MAARCVWLRGSCTSFPGTVSCLRCSVSAEECLSCVYGRLHATQRAFALTDLRRCRIPGPRVKFSSSPKLCSLCPQIHGWPCKDGCNRHYVLVSHEYLDYLLLSIYIYLDYLLLSYLRSTSECSFTSVFKEMSEMHIYFQNLAYL